ncbi:MAG TPA: hypothetical protein VFM05_11355, partial [Candidatus Saccharimonadales bacterium]|nr:hypothetical protein [Candidatus Saccharimonadales bacterium]
MKRMKKLSLIVILAIAFAGWFVVTHNRSESPAQKETGQAASFNKSQYSLTDPASLWVIVNKQRPLSNKNYKPSDLVAPNVPLRLPAGHEEMQMRAAGASAVEAMFAAA